MCSFFVEIYRTIARSERNMTQNASKYSSLSVFIFSFTPYLHFEFFISSGRNMLSQPSYFCDIGQEENFDPIFIQI